MDYASQITEILKLNMEQDQKEMLLNELANKMLEDKQKEKAAMPVFDRENEERNKELQQANKDLLEKNRKHTEELKRRIEQRKYDALLEEKMGILEHYKRNDNAGYLFQRSELEKMEVADLMHRFDIIKGDTKKFEMAKNEYLQAKKVALSKQAAADKMVNDEMEFTLKADKNNGNDLYKLDRIAQRLGVDASDLLEIAKLKKEKMEKKKQQTADNSNKEEKEQKEEEKTEEKTEQKEEEKTEEKTERKEEEKTGGAKTEEKNEKDVLEREEEKKVKKITEADEKLKSNIKAKATKVILILAGIAAVVALAVINAPTAVALVGGAYLGKEFNKGKKL